MTQVSLAERLRVLRARRGLSVSQASEGIGIEWHTLRDIELGRRKPYTPTLFKIAQFYGEPVEDLMQAAEVAEEPGEAVPPKVEAPTSQQPSLLNDLGELDEERREEELEGLRHTFGLLVRDVDELSDALRPELLQEALQDLQSELTRTRDDGYRVALEAMLDAALKAFRARATRVEHTRPAQADVEAIAPDEASEAQDTA